jgi:hypothetical protein
MKRIPRLSSAHVIATVALLVALSGTAGAAAVRLITGADIANGSVRGVDLAPDSVTGRHVPEGSLTGLDIEDESIRVKDLSVTARSLLRGPKGATGGSGSAGAAGATGETGATGPQGASGAPATLESTNSSGTDISDYVDGAPIVTATAAGAGFYLAIATGTVANTGGSDDYLNCGFDVAGSVAGAAGFSTTAGNTTSGSSVTVAATTTTNQLVKFVCFGNGVTSFDITNPKMKLIKLANQ